MQIISLILLIVACQGLAAPKAPKDPCAEGIKKLGIDVKYEKYVAAFQAGRQSFVEGFQETFVRQNKLVVDIANALVHEHLEPVGKKKVLPTPFLEYMREAVEYRYRLAHYPEIEASIVNNYGERLVDQTAPMTLSQLTLAAMITEDKLSQITEESERFIHQTLPIADSAFPTADNNPYFALLARMEKRLNSKLRPHFTDVKLIFHRYKLKNKSLPTSDRYEGRVYNEDEEKNGPDGKPLRTDEWDIVMTINRGGARISLRVPREKFPSFVLQPELDDAWSHVNLLTRKTTMVMPDDFIPVEPLSLREYIVKTGMGKSERLQACFWELRHKEK